MDNNKKTLAKKLKKLMVDIELSLNTAEDLVPLANTIRQSKEGSDDSYYDCLGPRLLTISNKINEVCNLLAPIYGRFNENGYA